MTAFRLTLATLLLAPAAQAQTVEETLYLTDSGSNNVGNDSLIFEVTVDDIADRANLHHIGTFPELTVDALAGSPDGSKLWAVGKWTRKLVSFDIATGELHEVGPIAPYYVVLATFSPSGDLVVANNSDRLWRVDTETAETTLLGTPTTASGSTVNISGADLAFDAEGVLYLWSNGSGLYALDYEAADGETIPATFQGGSGGPFFTGLAVRGNGWGNLVGSNTRGDELVLLDKSSGDLVERLPMYENGSRYAYGFGDMTTTIYEIPDDWPPEDSEEPDVGGEPDTWTCTTTGDGCTRTIGYWKTHADAWPAASLLIAGTAWSDDELMDILWDEPEGDATLILMHQLIASRLNNEVADAADVCDAMRDADGWLEAWPLYTDPQGADREAIIALADELDAYNNGLTETPHCDTVEVDDDADGGSGGAERPHPPREAGPPKGETPRY